MNGRRSGWETTYCSSCGGTGESWNPMRGLFDGPCLSCNGTGDMKVRRVAAADRAAAPPVEGK